MRNGLEKSSSLTETTGGPLASLHDAKKKKKCCVIVESEQNQI